MYISKSFKIAEICDQANRTAVHHKIFSVQLKLYFQQSNVVFEVLQQYFEVLSSNKETSDLVKKE